MANIKKKPVRLNAPEALESRIAPDGLGYGNLPGSHTDGNWVYIDGNFYYWNDAHNNLHFGQDMYGPWAGPGRPPSYDPPYYGYQDHWIAPYTPSPPSAPAQ